MIEPVETATALDSIGSGNDPEGVGLLAGRPALAVLIDDPASARELVLATNGLPCITIGISPQPIPEPPAFDLLICSEPEPPSPWHGAASGWEALLANVGAAIDRNPTAAIALAQLLRVSAGLGIGEALIAESFVYSTLQAGPEFARWTSGRVARRAHEREAQPVRTVRQDGILKVTLSRPSVRNALNADMRDALVDAFRIACGDVTVTAIQLDAAGPDFCSGGDLDEFGLGADPVSNHFVRMTRSPARWLWQCGTKAHAHVHGACVGAGIELTAFCADVSADTGASFRLPEVGMGLIPGAGGSASIPSRIGRERMAWMAITGDTIDAATALGWGLIDRIT